MFLPHFDVFCDLLLSRRTATWNLFVLYNRETAEKAFFKKKSFNITRKPAFAHFGEQEKKQFDVIYCLYKMKQSHWLLCVAKNCDWSRKITPLSNLSPRLKTYSESRIELRNLQVLRKCWNVSQCLSSEQPCEPKSLDVVLNIAGVDKIRLENLRLRSTLEAIRFEFWMKRALVTVEIYVLCGW